MRLFWRLLLVDSGGCSGIGRGLCRETLLFRPTPTPTPTPVGPLAAILDTYIPLWNFSPIFLTFWGSVGDATTK